MGEMLENRFSVREIILDDIRDKIKRGKKLAKWENKLLFEEHYIQTMKSISNRTATWQDMLYGNQ